MPQDLVCFTSCRTVKIFTNGRAQVGYLKEIRCIVNRHPERRFYSQVYCGSGRCKHSKGLGRVRKVTIAETRCNIKVVDDLASWRGVTQIDVRFFVRLVLVVLVLFIGITNTPAVETPVSLGAQNPPCSSRRLPPDLVTRSLAQCRDTRVSRHTAP